MPSTSAFIRSTTTIPWILFSMALVSVALHLWLGLASAHGLWMTVFMVAMAIACVPCTVNLLRSCSPKGLLAMMGLAVVSAVVHGAILVSALGGSGTVSGHGAHNHATANVGTGAFSVELIVLVIVELGVLILAYDQHSRRNVRVSVGSPARASGLTPLHHQA